MQIEKIKEKIELLKKLLENGFRTILPPQGNNKASMESWIAALEWVLEEEE